MVQVSGSCLLQAYFKGSREVPGTADPMLTNQYMSKSSVDLRVMITYATEAVRQLHVDHRRCRFWDESNLEVSPLYTVNLCYGQCRAKLAIKLCGCAPFFYVGVQQGKVNTSRKNLFGRSTDHNFWKCRRRLCSWNVRSRKYKKISTSLRCLEKDSDITVTYDTKMPPSGFSLVWYLF